MAKNKEFKRQAEATRLLEKIGATRRKSRKAGITVTGDLKESLRGRQSPEIANALKFTAKTAINEAEKLYSDLQKAGVEVCLDNREERPGVKFKDADLLGFPVRITVGKKAGEGLVEWKLRREKGYAELKAEQAVQQTIELVKNEQRG